MQRSASALPIAALDRCELCFQLPDAKRNVPPLVRPPLRNYAMDGVPRGDRHSPALFVAWLGDGSPELIEWPPLISEVGEEGQGEAHSQCAFDWSLVRALGNLIESS
jgi:hypothetical protein